LTNASGWIDRQEITEYINKGGTISYFSNYTLNANKTGYRIATHQYNVTFQRNKLDDFFTLMQTTCDYISGNWTIDCSENCEIISNVDVGGNNISIIGTGVFVTAANITNYNHLLIQGTDINNKCTVRCLNGGCFKN
jgi:hypothetical protein